MASRRTGLGLTGQCADDEQLANPERSEDKYVGIEEKLPSGVLLTTVEGVAAVGFGVFVDVFERRSPQAASPAATKVSATTRAATAAQIW